MLPYISDCMIHVTLSDLITLLYQPNPLNTVLSNKTQDLLKSFESVHNITVYCNLALDKLKYTICYFIHETTNYKILLLVYIHGIYFTIVSCYRWLLGGCYVYKAVLNQLQHSHPAHNALPQTTVH